MTSFRSLLTLLLCSFLMCCGGTEPSQPLGPPNNINPVGTDTSQGLDAGGSDSAGIDASVIEPPAQIGGFPSPELFLQIIGPSSADHVSVGSGATYIAGTLFGSAKEIQWTSNSGQTGKAKVSKFWNTTPITLVPGDNEIVVTAIGENEQSEDRIVITYNPGFFFDGKSKARPSAFFTNTPVDVVVTIPVSSKNVLASTVALWEVDEDGNNGTKLGSMVDTGDTSAPNCDEIQDDGVFSRCAQLQSNTATIKYFRVTLDIDVGGSLHTVFSPLIPIEIVDPITSVECTKMNSAQNDALTLYYSMYQSEVTAGNANAAQKARAEAMAALQANPIVAEAGVDPDGGVWTRFEGGVLGALNIPTVGYRGGSEGSGGFGSATGGLMGNTIQIQSRNLLALAPFNSELGQEDEIPTIVKRFGSQSCPKYTIDGPHLNAKADLRAFRSAYEYGIVALSGHANTYFRAMSPVYKEAFGWEHSGSQELLWTGEPVQCSELSNSMVTCSSDSDCPAKSECVITKATQSGWSGSSTGICVDHTQIDLRRGRIVMGAKSWAVHPSFFRKHSARMWPNSLVYLGACRTLYNGTLASELFGLGVTTVAGFTDYVTSAFAQEQSEKWFTKILDGRKTTGQAMILPVSDPVHPVGQFRIFGGNNLEITDYQIINPGFESGETTGWTVEGDGRVIGRLGISMPVAGKFMGILSTGLGYTQQTGELSQSFCIDEGVTSLSIYWKFFSEEFLEFCGDVYQDTFEATLTLDQGGQLKLVRVTIDDLCSTEDCAGGDPFGSPIPGGSGGCGSHQYTVGQCAGEPGVCKNDSDCSTGSCEFGLVESTVHFDQEFGDVYNTPWQHLTKDVSSLAGAGPVTLRLFATDTGDSIYDSAILVDSISFD